MNHDTKDHSADDPLLAPEDETMLPVEHCPFCGNTTFVHTGYNDISFFTCGQMDDGSDGCGAITSFRTAPQGYEARRAYNRRVTK